MRRFLPFVLLIFCLGAAAPMTEADAVRIVLTANPVPADLFSSSFLAQVPAEQLTPVRNQVIAPLGTFVRAEGSEGQYTAYFTHGTLKVMVHLDAQGKIDAMLLRDPVVSGTTMKDAAALFNALPGDVSYLVIKNGKDAAAHNADQRYSVGSTFKLAVLNALKKQVDSGKRKWSDVVLLAPQWKSLPSGVLQTWPDETPLTLSTLATEMISISDNTAADSLIHVVGQRALAAFARGNKPFLTTREMFLLKSKANAALRERFRAGTSQQKQAMLSQIDRQALPGITDLDTSPQLSDIEWHYSNRDLCSLMQTVHTLPMFDINPGLASPSQWKHIAYKGGSDFGVISMTTWLQAKDGTTYCVSATWNDRTAPVDETKFASAYSVLIGALTAPRTAK